MVGNLSICRKSTGTLGKEANSTGTFLLWGNSLSTKLVPQLYKYCQFNIFTLSLIPFLHLKYVIKHRKYWRYIIAKVTELDKLHHPLHNNNDGHQWSFSCSSTILPSSSSMKSSEYEDCCVFVLLALADTAAWSSSYKVHRSDRHRATVASTQSAKFLHFTCSTAQTYLKRCPPRSFRAFRVSQRPEVAIRHGAKWTLLLVYTDISMLAAVCRHA